MYTKYTTVPKIVGKFQNDLNAFSKEREITDANSTFFNNAVNFEGI